MKRYRGLSIFIVMILLTTIFATFVRADIPANTIQIYVNSKLIAFPDAQPFFDNNNRCQVPVRFIAENLGYKVEWNQEKRQATITGNETSIVLTLDSNKALVNGQTVTFDTYVVLKDGRTFVPLRFVSENLGAKVEYNYINKVHRIDITTAVSKIPDSTYSIGTITGFKTLNQKTVTGAEIIANVEALSTAVLKDAFYIEREFGAMATLGYNPQRIPNNTGDGLLKVVSSLDTDYEVVIIARTWPAADLKTHKTCIAIAEYAKEIIRQYFPKKYEEVYKLMDYSFTGEVKVLNKVFSYDGREVFIRTSGMYISYIGGNVDSVK